MKIKDGLETPSVEPPPVAKGKELGKSIDWSVGVILVENPQGDDGVTEVIVVNWLKTNLMPT